MTLTVFTDGSSILVEGSLNEPGQVCSWVLEAHDMQRLRGVHEESGFAETRDEVGKLWTNHAAYHVYYYKPTNAPAKIVVDDGHIVREDTRIYEFHEKLLEIIGRPTN